MFAYIKGNIAEINPTDLILEISSGVAYQISISVNTFNEIKSLEKVKILTHLVVKEDSHTLYGFYSAMERHLFRLLISVSGVGPNTARVLLSALSPEEIRSAIVSENIAVLKKAKGIGPKAAKRIILELKDKILKDSGAASEEIQKTLTPNKEAREEALSALIALGFNRVQINKALNNILSANPELSDAGNIIKKALSLLTS